jgi:hypothetical protein
LYLNKELMLKFIYTEADLYLEVLTTELEEWVSQRLAFAAGMGESMSVRAERAAFPLPQQICEAAVAGFHLHCEDVETVTIDRCDSEHLEVGLNGYWLSTHVDLAEGIFVAQLPDRVESNLWELWSTAKGQLITR